MHRLTCNDADRLAADLDQAAALLGIAAADLQRRSDGLAVVGDFRWSRYHAAQADEATTAAKQLRDYAVRLRSRSDLWPVKRAPSQRRAAPLVKSCSQCSLGRAARGCPGRVYSG